jgi:ethanolamine utilization protein EutQ (cupin superfamily)
MTTDFRRVYATSFKEWLGYDDTDAILRGRFEPLGAFA